jgi:hypothetical protein
MSLVKVRPKDLDESFNYTSVFDDQSNLLIAEEGATAT